MSVYIKFSFNRECMERNVITSFWILSSFDCFLRYFQTEWSVFLPFSVNCSQVAMFQIMPALCPHGQREGGAGQPNVDRPGKGKGVPKNSQICATSFMDDPLVIKLRNSDFKVH